MNPIAEYRDRKAADDKAIADGIAWWRLAKPLIPFRPMTHANRPATALGLGRDDYWRFLRLVYGMGALDAWNYIKRMRTPPTVQQVRDAISHKEEH